ncbi:unnamed protein product [Rotaria socialis]|uniref:Uncharacterized protein n=1 Tax=Rotaria socialis TaxID=392032 RepID=A0A818CDN5_9BILA|nr:unnamed protein product [Rotaria socialis]CAF4871031.1 unnamed protein product [Rotaria socialis]
MKKYLTFSSDDESEIGDNDTEDRIDVVADKASEQQQQHTQSLATRSKQLTLFNMWKNENKVNYHKA